MRIPQPVENELTSVLLHLSLLKAVTPKGLSTSQLPVWFRSPFVALSSSRAPLIPLTPFGLRSGPRARCAALLSSGMQQDTRRRLACCPVSSWRLAAPLGMRTPPRARPQRLHVPDPAGGSGSPTSYSARWLGRARPHSPPQRGGEALSC